MVQKCKARSWMVWSFFCHVPAGWWPTSSAYLHHFYYPLSFHETVMLLKNYRMMKPDAWPTMLALWIDGCSTDVGFVDLCLFLLSTCSLGYENSPWELWGSICSVSRFGRGWRSALNYFCSCVFSLSAPLCTVIFPFGNGNGGCLRVKKKCVWRWVRVLGWGPILSQQAVDK